MLSVGSLAFGLLLSFFGFPLTACPRIADTLLLRFLEYGEVDAVVSFIGVVIGWKSVVVFVVSLRSLRLRLSSPLCSSLFCLQHNITHSHLSIMTTLADELPPLSPALQMGKESRQGIKTYYIQKIEELEVTLREKEQDVRRLEAQRNEWNSKGERKFATSAPHTSSLHITSSFHSN
jgi:hypothetical protein